MAKRKKTAPAPSDAGALKKALVRERDALRKLLDDKVAELREVRAKGADSWDRQWEIVGEIFDADPPLWQGRYTSELKFQRAVLPGEDPRSVRRNVIVARAFRPEDVEARGVALLEEIALYVKDKGGMTEPPRALDLRRVIIEVPDGRDTRRVAGERVELAEVKAARRALNKKPAKKLGPRASAVRKILDGRKALKKLGASLSEQHASFTRVPLEQLAALGAALSKLKLPKL